MARFDAELYLRLLGEEMLLSSEAGRRGPFGSPLSEAAEALLAVGAISRARARSVLDDYALAEALREQDTHGVMMHRQQTRRRRKKPKPLKPRRVVPCGTVIDSPAGTLEVRYVILAADSTQLAVTVRPHSSTTGRRARRALMGMGPMHSFQVTVADDRGLATGTHFSGGGSDTLWEGHLTAQQPLAVDTAWVEVNGTRVQLRERPAPYEIRVETLPQQEPALRYLEHRLASPERFHQGEEQLDDAVAALVAAGALAQDDPRLAELRSVHTQLPRHPRGRRAGGGSSRLPEPWRSLGARLGREDGPTGTVALGAVTPEFDAYVVAVASLESSPHSFTLEVEAAGALAHGPFAPALAGGRLAWWASDDRGNHYLGQMGGWSGADDSMSGTIEFEAPLDPKAMRLEIMPTGDTARAVISVELPWSPRKP